ncbi:ATP-binding protein [Morganella psychrotolerans]|uniref:AAA+ ATPase domain-containing protein n=1 Tax=Morganella psychrotolerans TaxID=368603 RepID=A0A1B8H0K9_9GAMM|nr:ATP-binding protein [Morganella psychrotolerans]OBU02591.1 hypothetical protein AYY17_13165 [Morganella psychrotolerans]
MSDDEAIDATNGSSPVGRGGAGVYIEGQVGAFYLITLLANTEPRGLPGSRILSVGFQGKDLGYALDDLYMQGMSASGKTLLEIQSKRTITFSPRDSVFKEVCEQIAKSFTKDIPEERHRLAVATQRTSKAISGPYQDVLKWARTAQNGVQFFQRLDNKGIYGAEMRKFSKTFQTNLIAAGVPKDDETIWKIFKRFLILEFDFESCSPLAHTHVLSISKQILSPEDESRSEALWSNLIEISLESAKTGRVIDRLTLQNILIGRGFRLLSDKKFYIARERMAELSCQSLADIGNTIAGIHLPRLRAVALLEKALDEHRFVEIKGGPGVGKSAVLRNAAERIISEALVLVLDPLTTPEGGWAALSQVLNIRTTLKEFLNDLAVSGGGVLFIDSLEMFTSPAQRRTINDLLREIAVTNGFSVVATSRLHFNSETESWLAPDVISTLGQPQTIIVNELDEEEVKTLRILAPELGLLLKSSHPASSIARNLYRLSRLLKVPSVAKVHSEVTLAQQWWKSADNADPVVLRAAQRLIARIAEATLAGRDLLNVYDDSPARSHLLDSQSLIEPNRDHLRFYHDVLRDWAIGARLQEEDGILSRLNLEVPTSPKISRGIEFAGRFALELNPDCNSWLRLLEKLSPPGAHSSWRREALMAIIRSELSQEQLERCSQILLVNNGSLLIELSIAITTIETVPPADFVSGKSEELIMWASSIPKEIRIASSDSALKLLIWCIRHAAEIPIQAIASILALVETLLLLFQKIPVIAEATGNMLFDWLVKLDDPDSNISIPGAQTRNLSIEHYRMLERLRITSLTFSSYIPVRLKTYLKALLEQKKILYACKFTSCKFHHRGRDTSRICGFGFSKLDST